MPYDIRKHGNKYEIVRKDDGVVVGHSDSKSMAEASVRARLAGEHGWKGKKK